MDSKVRPAPASGEAEAKESADRPANAPAGARPVEADERPASSAGPAGAAAAPIDLLGIRSFFPVELAVVCRTDRLPFHLYVRDYGRGFVPFRFAGTPLRDADRQKLLVRGIRQVYVDIRQHEVFWKHMSAQLPAILADESIDALERARLFYQAADRLVEDFATGLTRDHLVRARGLVRLLAGHAVHTNVLANAMEEVVAVEPRPGAHPLHVTAHALHMAATLRLPVHQMAEFALGCMLHDAARVAAPQCTATGQPAAQSPDGPALSDQAEDPGHPNRGAERLRELAANCPGAIAVVREHHERLDGGGFPANLPGEKIHRWARICALADAYDDRVMGTSGQTAVSPEQALAAMKQQVGARFDPELFELFIQQVNMRPGPSVRPGQPLRGAMPTPILPGGKKADRRQFPRFPFRKPLVVRPANDAAADQDRTVQCVDLSRGGVHFIAEQPLPAGQSIRLMIPSDTGPAKQMLAKVMHCRRLASGEGYDVGAKFVRV